MTVVALQRGSGDASPSPAVVWPCSSFRELWEDLHLHGAAARDEAFLERCKPWVVAGLRAFRPFSQESADKLARAQTHSELAIKFERTPGEGDASDAISAPRQQAALAVAPLLGLDGTQAYVLLFKMEQASARSAWHAGPPLAAQDLPSREDLVHLACEFYLQERQALLECVLEVHRAHLSDDGEGIGEPAAARSVFPSGVLSLAHRACFEAFEASLPLLPVRAKPSGTRFQTDEASGARAARQAGALPRCPNGLADLGLAGYWAEQQTLEQLLLVHECFLFHYPADELGEGAATRRPDDAQVQAEAAALVDFLQRAPAYVLGGQAAANLRSACFASASAFALLLDVDGLLERIGAGAMEGVEGAAGRTGGVGAARHVPPALSGALDADPTATADLLLIHAVFSSLHCELAGEGATARATSLARANAALSHGALERLLAALQDGLVGSGADATAFHSVTKNLCSALLVAFDLQPGRMPPGALHAFLALLAQCFCGEPLLAEQYWDEGYDLDQPIRHFVTQCQQLFPYKPVPYLELLSSLCGTGTGEEEGGGDASAEANRRVAEAFRNLPSVSALHAPGDLMDASSEIPLKHQSSEKLASSVGGLVRVTRGCLFQIPLCPGLVVGDAAGQMIDFFPQGQGDGKPKVLVSWRVQADGHFVLLSRLEHLSQLADPLPYAREAGACLRFLCSLARGSGPDSLRGLVGRGGARLAMLDVLAHTFDKFSDLALHTAPHAAEAEGLISEVLAGCLGLAECVAACEPNEAAQWLGRVMTVGASTSPRDAAAARGGPARLSIPKMQAILGGELARGSGGVSAAFMRLAGTLAGKGALTPDTVTYFRFAVLDVLGNAQGMAAVRRKVGLLGASFRLIGNCLRGSLALEEATAALAGSDAGLASLGWLPDAAPFLDRVRQCLADKHLLVALLRSSCLLAGCREAEALHLRGRLARARAAERLASAAGEAFLALLAHVRAGSLPDHCLPDALAHTCTSNPNSMAGVLTSFCTYRFDASLRSLSFRVLSGLLDLTGDARVAARVGGSFLQGCRPFSLVAESSRGFLKLFADPFAPCAAVAGGVETEEAGGDATGLLRSQAAFLCSLLRSKHAFPAVLVPSEGDGEGEGLQWVRDMCARVAAGPAGGGAEPLSWVMEVLEHVWACEGGLMLRRAVMQDVAAWKQVLSMASQPQNWSALEAGAGDGSQDQPSLCQAHACALGVASREFFLQGATSSRESHAEVWGSWAASALPQLARECGAVHMDASRRAEVQGRLRAELVALARSGAAGEGAHLGIAAVLGIAAEAERSGMHDALDLPVEVIFLAWLDKTREGESARWVPEVATSPQDLASLLCVDSAEDAGDALAGVVAAVRGINGQARLEAASLALARSLSCLASLMVETGAAAAVPGAGAGGCAVDLTAGLQRSLQDVSNLEPAGPSLGAGQPAREVVLAWNAQLAEALGALSGALDAGSDAPGDQVAGSREWHHDWLVFLLPLTPQSAAARELALKLMSLLEVGYRRSLGPGGDPAEVSAGAPLRSFSLACAHCRGSERARLASLLVIRHAVDGWLSRDMPHGEWVSELEQGAAIGELCRIGDAAGGAELRAAQVAAASAVAKTPAGARMLLRHWKASGMYQRLISHSARATGAESHGQELRGEWCAVLGLVGAMLYSCADFDRACEGMDALEVFVAAYTDQLCDPVASLLRSFPSGPPNTPQVDASRLGEVEHVVFLLLAVMKFARRWHVAVPRAMRAIQPAAADFLLFAGQPGLKPYARFELLRPRTAWAGVGTGQEVPAVSEGWFTALSAEGEAAGGEAGAESGGKGGDLARWAAHAIYRDACLLLDFLDVSLPFAETARWDVAPLTDALAVAVVGIQAQAVHICSSLRRRAAEASGSTPQEAQMLRLLSHALYLTNAVTQRRARSGAGAADRHGRGAWGVMSSLSFAHTLLGESLGGAAGGLDAQGAVRSSKDLIEQQLREGTLAWAGNLSDEEALLSALPD